MAWRVWPVKLWFMQRFHCKHENVRCIHGDEIWQRRYRRRACLTCGRALKGPLPERCTVSGKPHASFYGDTQPR